MESKSIVNSEEEGGDGFFCPMCRSKNLFPNQRCADCGFQFLVLEMGSGTDGPLCPSCGDDAVSDCFRCVDCGAEFIIM